MRKQITLLQNVMKKYGLNMYLVPTSDEHQSEYIPEYYKFRAYLSGFTGSAGTLLVTEEKCLLWTDGRYFIQAEKQLENSGIILMKSGEANVPTLEEYIFSNIKIDSTLGFNGALFSCAQMKKLIDKIEQIGAYVQDIDLSNEVWKNAPAIAVGKVKELDIRYTGIDRIDKISMLRDKMKEIGADLHIISSLDDIAWLFNLRGNDIPYNPVFYSYAVVSDADVLLFVKPFALMDEVVQRLIKDNIQVKNYDQFFEHIHDFCINKKVLLDPSKTSYRAYRLLIDKNEIIEDMNPSTMLKSLKTKRESANIKSVHEVDGLVMTRFIYWVKNEVAKGNRVTEYDAAKHLDQMRLAEHSCMDLSFDTIAAYGENAAMCHYSPDKEHPVILENEGFLLVDSGGQYLEGTTDITRTIAVGTLTMQQKKHYTLVLQGHIRLSMARFPEGVCGANLDILARGPLWNEGLDFNHGTGHGVGCYLNVHEWPNNIYWNLQRKTATTIPFMKGMLVSNEPGLYLENRYGIRIENLMLTKKVENTHLEGFLEFDTVTRVPYERDAIIPELLSDVELNWLNQYHTDLFELYNNKLLSDEREWLRKATEPLLKKGKE